MRTSTLESEAVAVDVALSADSLRLTIDDGRQLSVPLAWFPRLLRGGPEQRNQWELIGRSEGLHCEALDEDISIIRLLAGRSEHNRTRSQAAQFEARWSASPSRNPNI